MTALRCAGTVGIETIRDIVSYKALVQATSRAAPRPPTPLPPAPNKPELEATT
jgi:hypothetical protein